MGDITVAAINSKGLMELFCPACRMIPRWRASQKNQMFFKLLVQNPSNICNDLRESAYWDSAAKMVKRRRSER
jgi:uncharacterized membrane protein